MLCGRFCNSRAEGCPASRLGVPKTASRNLNEIKAACQPERAAPSDSCPAKPSGCTHRCSSSEYLHTPQHFVRVLRYHTGDTRRYLGEPLRSPHPGAGQPLTPKGRAPPPSCRCTEPSPRGRSRSAASRGAARSRALPPRPGCSRAPRPRPRPRESRAGPGGGSAAGAPCGGLAAPLGTRGAAERTSSRFPTGQSRRCHPTHRRW